MSSGQRKFSTVENLMSILNNLSYSSVQLCSIFTAKLHRKDHVDLGYLIKSKFSQKMVKCKQQKRSDWPGVQSLITELLILSSCIRGCSSIEFTYSPGWTFKNVLLIKPLQQATKHTDIIGSAWKVVSIHYMWSELHGGRRDHHLLKWK